GAGRALTRPRAAGPGGAGLGLVARPPRPRDTSRPRALRDRPRLRGRPFAERGRRVPEPAARDGEDAHTQRAGAPRRRSGGGVVVRRDELEALVAGLDPVEQGRL